jgi:predicted exporter
MPLEYILSVLALLLGSGISLGLAIYLERRHHAPGARLFTLFLLALVFWSVLYIFELSSTTLQSIVSWVYLEYVGIVVVPSAWLCFILDIIRNSHQGDNWRKENSGSG